jgi:hypothetical protein
VLPSDALARMVEPFTLVTVAEMHGPCDPGPGVPASGWPSSMPRGPKPPKPAAWGWRPARLASEGHSSAEWQDALDGTLCRLGQLYREFARRWDEARAWHEIEETVRILLFCVTADAA